MKVFLKHHDVYVSLNTPFTFVIGDVYLFEDSFEEQLCITTKYVVNVYPFYIWQEGFEVCYEESFEVCFEEKTSHNKQLCNESISLLHELLNKIRVNKVYYYFYVICAYKML